ncbi:MAG: hypothetical protein WBO12_00315 [Xanthobacteraceae bacterium]
MMPTEWHDWHDFYMLLGTGSAALVALLFVAVSIGAVFSRRSGQEETDYVVFS